VAKTTIYCAECGASINVYGRNRTDADRKAAWHEQVGTLCPNCQEKKNASENAKYAAANAAAGLPPLSGSEKQVAWAETLRAKVFRQIEQALPIAKAEDPEAVIKAMVPSIDTFQLAENARKLGHILETPFGDKGLEAFLTVLRSKTRAVWWIENPLGDLFYLARLLQDEIKGVLLGEPEPSPEQIEAEEEALLRPAGEPVSSIIIDVRQEEGLVAIRFPSMEKANGIVRDMGFKWFRGRWFRQMNEMTGDTLDRMAEVAQRLVAGGYLVRVNDDQARERAVSGRFEPEHRRWVSMDREGRLVLSWARDDDLYDVARRILGARYKDKHIRVPVGSIEEVADFAGHYDLRMTDVVLAALERHRQAVAGGAVVTNIKEPPTPIKGETIIPTLTAEPCDIAPELAEE